MRVNQVVNGLKNLSMGLLFGTGIYSAPVLASPFSVSMSLGQASTDLGEKQVDITAYDDSDTSYGIEFGYQFELAELKIGYVNLGQASVDIEGQSYTPMEYHERVKKIAPVLVEGITIGADVNLYQQDKLFIDGQFGGIIWQNVIESSSNTGDALRSKDRGTETYVGVAAGYHLTENWSVSAQYRAYVLTEVIQDISVKLKYDF